MKTCGLAFAGIGLSTGISSLVLFHFNLIVWATLALSLGSTLGLVGSALVIWTLFCRIFLNPLRDADYFNLRVAAA